MSELREKLKVRAQEKLDSMTQDLVAAALDITEETNVDYKVLCRIVSSPKHSKTLVNQSISTIVRRMENELLEAVEDDAL